MQPVDLLTDLPAVDQAFVDAVAAVSGLRDVLVLDTFCGVDRETGEFDENASRREADVYIEWRRFNGVFGLNVRIFSPKPLVAPMSEAGFVLRLAAALQRPFVIGDCDANPWAYYRIYPDGTLQHVYTRTDDKNGDPVFDLVCDLDPSDPDYIEGLVVWPTGHAWPQKPADAPDYMPPAIRRFCRHDESVAGKLCESFWAPCPKKGLNRW